MVALRSVLTRLRTVSMAVAETMQAAKAESAPSACGPRVSASLERKVRRGHMMMMTPTSPTTTALQRNSLIFSRRNTAEKMTMNRGVA